MAGPTAVARAHRRRRLQLKRETVAAARKAWRQVDRKDPASWQELLPLVLAKVATAQADAATEANPYLEAVLAAQAISSVTNALVDPAQLAGIASDGRSLANLLFLPAITFRQRVTRGDTLTRAAAAGEKQLIRIVGTQVNDAGRVADQVALVAHPTVGGYTRMLDLPSCSRCIVLAGKWFRWNRGFRRHPLCDCIHIPGDENADDLRTNPAAVFESLSPAEQDRIFTKDGAEAIRLGADISQVVNARRGARGLTTAGARVTAEEARMLRGGRQRGRLETVELFGRQVFVTSEGVTRRGIAGQRLGASQGFDADEAETVTRVTSRGREDRTVRRRRARTPRLMPESILQIAAGDRDEAVRLLRRFGYII